MQGVPGTIVEERFARLHGAAGIGARCPEPHRQAEPGAEAKPKKRELTLVERFQSVIGILNEANKFHREINVEPELRMEVPVND